MPPEIPPSALVPRPLEEGGWLLETALSHKNHSRELLGEKANGQGSPWA